MHILVTNDDGPPSNQSSPYVHSLVTTLQSAGHLVSVILPHTQRSWIGKAHFVAQNVEPTYFRPGTVHQDNGTTHTEPLRADEEGEEWVLVNTTPASCMQLGLYHFFQDRPPVDLVVSGPNYGRNSTALFALSSGTIGGAMEAAVCGQKSIALSYAFYNRNHDPDIIAGAARQSLKLIEHFGKSWGEDVDLYSINVPLIEGVENNKVMFTTCLQNTWKSGSSFKVIEGNEASDPQTREKEIRQQEAAPEGTDKSQGHPRHTHRQFRWAPDFADVHKSVEESGEGFDGWTLNQGHTSVTPLKAKFAEAQAHPLGELKLSSTASTHLSTSQETKLNFVANIAYEDPYVQPLLLKALEALPRSSHKIISTPFTSSSSLESPPFLHITSYEALDHSALLSQPSYIGNAYTIRKALIRKHYLANTIESWLPKHPESPLKRHVPLTTSFELDYAEFLDDALLEAWELKESWERNAEKEPADREWWILKPGMSDRGQGIRLFSTEDELQTIFEEWEAENPEDDEDEEEEEILDSGDDHEANRVEQTSDSDDNAARNGLITSQLRHFVAQPYIAPLIISDSMDRKFHIRSYVLCVGALDVFVYRDMLALFAPDPYVKPGRAPKNDSVESVDDIDMRRHLTNTCLQDGTRDGSVMRYWDLPLSHTEVLQSAFDSICATTGELFRAATANPTTFQPLPNAFEAYGVDWLLDERGTPKLLECNAFPDFQQSGRDLSTLVGGFWMDSLDIVANKLLGTEMQNVGGESKMVQVLDLDLGRR